MSEVLFQPFPMMTGRRAQAWRHRPGFRRPRHFHAEPEINIVTRGVASLGIGDRVFRVQAGGVLLFHPGQDHVLLEASPDLELFVVALRPELAERACGSLAHVTSSGYSLTSPELRQLEDTLTALEQVTDAQVVEQRLSDAFRSVRKQLAANHVLSRRALQGVLGNLEGSANALARRLGVDPSTLSRQFHEDLSVTFVEYRARQRLMTFVKLADEGRRLSGAALEAGFGSYAQCHRVFSRTLGCAPQSYFAGQRARISEAKYDADAGGRPALVPSTVT